MTLDEAALLEKELGRPWYQINPLLSAGDCRAVLISFLSRTVDPTVARDKVGKVTIGHILDHIEAVRDDDLPNSYVDGVPLAEDATTTGGSSPAPDGSGGPQT